MRQESRKLTSDIDMPKLLCTRLIANNAGTVTCTPAVRAGGVWAGESLQLEACIERFTSSRLMLWQQAILHLEQVAEQTIPAEEVHTP